MQTYLYIVCVFLVSKYMYIVEGTWCIRTEHCGAILKFKLIDFLK